MIHTFGINPPTGFSSIKTLFSRCEFPTLTVWLCIAMLVALTYLNVANAQSDTAVNCPVGNDKSFPEYAGLGEPPNVEYWSKIPALPEHCFVSLESPAKLTIALAGTFAHTGTVEDIATRLGAISKAKDLLYWSVTDQRWSALISEAIALNSKNIKDTRPDFTSQEVLSGQSLEFAHDDTRTWGLNQYTGMILESSPVHLIFASHNSSPIKIGPLTVFKPEDAQSVLFVNRLDDFTWTAYSLSVIRRSRLPTRKQPLINRQIAFYRLLTGQKTDSEPPYSP